MVSKKDIIGKTREEAEILLTNENVRYRIVKVDGDARIVTADYRPERFNLVIVDGYVTEVGMG